MNEKEIDSIVTNILNSSDIGREKLKQMIIKQWQIDKRLKKLEEVSEEQQRFKSNSRTI